MTTTVTIKTHGWPARIITTDRYVRGETTTETVTTERLDRWQTRDYVLTDTRALAFEELTAEGWQEDPRKTDSDGSDGA